MNIASHKKKTISVLRKRMTNHLYQAKWVFAQIWGKYYCREWS